MAELHGQLLPLAILGILAPVPAAIVVTLLMTRDGLAKASGFVGAATGVYLVIGGLALLLPLESLGSAASVAGGLLLITFGLALWWFALRQLRRIRRGALPPASFLGALESRSLRAVVLGGSVLTLVNVKQLGLYLVGVSAIVHADLTVDEEWATLVVFLLVFQAGQLVLIGGYAVARERASALLVRFHDWLLPRIRVASVVLGSLVGALFLALGVGLLTS